MYCTYLCEIYSTSQKHSKQMFVCKMRCDIRIRCEFYIVEPIVFCGGIKPTVCVAFLIQLS